MRLVVACTVGLSECCVCEPVVKSKRPTSHSKTKLIKVAEMTPPSTGDESKDDEDKDGSYCRLEINIQ